MSRVHRKAGRRRDLVAEAVAYEHGEGVTKDQRKAAALYCEAARKGDTEAQFSLGWMYALGRGVARDDAIAASLFTLAAAGGHAYAQKSLKLVGDERGPLPDCMGSPESPWVDTEVDHDRGPDYFANLPPWKKADRRHRGAPRAALCDRSEARIVGHPGRIELRATRAFGTQCSRTDAAYPRNRGSIQRRESCSTCATIFVAGFRICAGFSRTIRDRFRLRWPRTTPAKRQSTGTGASRPTRKRANTFDECCSCFAAIGNRTIPVSSSPRRSLQVSAAAKVGVRHVPCSRRIEMCARPCRLGSGPRVPARGDGHRRQRHCNDRTRQEVGGCHRHLRAHANAAISVPGDGVRGRRRNADCDQFARASWSTRPDEFEVLAILLPAQGKDQVQVREAKRLSVDPDSDLALLRIDGPALPALRLRDSEAVGKVSRTVHRVSDRAGARRPSGNPSRNGGSRVTDRHSAGTIIRTRRPGDPPPCEWRLSDLPARRNRLPREQRQPRLRPGFGRGHRHCQHGVRQGDQGKRI